MRFVRLALSICVPVAVLVLGGAAQAQTLDSENVRLLSNNCAALNHNASTDDPDFGPGLDLICQIPGSGTGSSAGANAATSFSAGATVANRREERFESPPKEAGGTDAGSGFGLFFSGDYESLDRARSTYEDGFDSDVWRGTGGVDYLLAENLLVGGFFTYANDSGDFDAGGDFETDSYTPTLFASFLPIPELYVDATISYTRHEYDRDRFASYTRQSVPDDGTSATISGKASSDTSGDEIAASFAVGYDHAIESINLGPYAGLNFSYQNIDSYGENGGTGLELDVRDQYVTSLQSVVGLQVAMAISAPFGVLSPYANAEYIHEFENDQRDIRVHYVDDLNAAVPFSFETQDPDRDYMEVGGGVVLTLPGGFHPFADFRALVGNSYFDSYKGTLGLRIDL